MRDINRIPKMLKLIETVWREVPDWRLGQLLVNVVNTLGGVPMDNNLFYIEDEDLMKALEKIAERDG